MRNQTGRSIKDLPYLKCLKLAHPFSTESHFEIDILIGADFYWSVVGNHTIRGNGPTAVSSKLGYLLSGLLSDCDPINSARVYNVDVTSHRSEEVNLQKFWDLESIGVTDATDAASKEFNLLDYCQSSLTTSDTGRYTAKLPWKSGNAPLPTNYYVTRNITQSMIRRLSPQIRNVYHNIIMDQLSRDIIEEVTDDDRNIGHYLPHRAVKKESSTTPIRIVYNASLSTAGNPSLNDCLETGPTLLNDLGSILIRFRLHKF
ncbi:uncharacterized protein LOC141904369 [Tubulanus polymorphus]|uniref:uncharacterized protein LOC141904369 n=1 Tax=Tubulanus polymorphus TaxID=672921 RepID=UPI003DA42BF0